MEIIKKEAFKVIGITVRTSNGNGQAAQDIGALWNKFMSEGIVEKIPNKIDDTIYSIYTDYEGDHTQPYTTLLGCRVGHLSEVPEGMEAKSFENSTYAKFTAKGDLTKMAVVEEWQKVWGMDKELDRLYTADFEVYGEKAQDPSNGEADIFVAVKE
jgi:predicted transcriptional regulator YdeE